jgi:hypothetical protein
MLVNSSGSSSSSTIELDQSDNRLTEAVMASNDYIGFYDTSSGLQSKTLISDMPGWQLFINSSLGDTVKAGDIINFANGENITFNYDANTNTVSADAVGQSVDLYINDVLVESDINALNLKEDAGIHLEYNGSGEVVVSSTNAAFDGLRTGGIVT